MCKNDISGACDTPLWPQILPTYGFHPHIFFFSNPLPDVAHNVHMSPHLPSGCTPLTPYPPVLAAHPPGWMPRMASSSLGSASGKEDLDDSSWSPWPPLWWGWNRRIQGGLWVEEWGSFSSWVLFNLPMAQPTHLEDEVETYWRKGQ